MGENLHNDVLVVIMGTNYVSVNEAHEKLSIVLRKLSGNSILPRRILDDFAKKV